MSASKELRDTLTALWDRISAIKSELEKLRLAAEDPLSDREALMVSGHSLRQEMVRVRKRIYELTEDDGETPTEVVDEFTHSGTNPYISLDDTQSGLK
ncbi:MAG: hypothetical protein ABL958_19265 [Bdellovibrionia bacterium]